MIRPRTTPDSPLDFYVLYMEFVNKQVCSVNIDTAESLVLEKPLALHLLCLTAYYLYSLFV